ncbi:MAG: aminodeoxychorismate synthase component I [Flavobacteriales bacterium]
MILASQFHNLISLPEWKNHVVVLHSHDSKKPALIGLGCEDLFRVNLESEKTLDAFQIWLDQNKDWVFGFIAYDAKNAIENLTSRHPNTTGFPDLHFVKPRVVIRVGQETIEVVKNNSLLSSDAIIDLIHHKEFVAVEEEHIELQPRITQVEYLSAIRQLLHHIQQGDIYEVNYCQEFFGNHTLRDPYQLWAKLNSFTEAPLSAYIQSESLYLMCASPERFMQKIGDSIISQPIKGTIRRGRDFNEDQILKDELHNNKKERSENVMIVDLVRNDLAQIAQKGSVEVEELFGIHSFKTVHHMISTIRARVKAECTFTDILRAMFPMGSMTGAPKIRAMQLIDQYEHNRRGIYSGSVGYITPQGDFDFNVVIRSLVYNKDTAYLSCCVGSAITAQCDPQKEYEECLLKAEALFKSLSSQEAKTTSSESQIARTAS